MKKTLSFVLVVFMLLMSFSTTGFAISDEKLSVNSEEIRGITLEDVLAGVATPEEYYGALNEENVPEAVGANNAKARNHIQRLYSEEGDSLNNVIFRNADGSKTLYLFNYPVKYVTDSGKTRDISLNISQAKSADDKAFISTANSAKTSFSEKLSDGIMLEGNGVNVSLIPLSIAKNDNTTNKVDETTISNSSTAKLIDSKKVSYTLDSKTTLEYSLTYTGFKEDIVVKEYTGQTEYHFKLKTNGLTLKNIQGCYHLVDDKGVIKANIGDIIVFTADEHNNTMGEMTYRVVKEKEEYILTIHLDADYLSSEKTVYPIRIDPTIEINYGNNGAGVIEDVTINSLGGSNGASNSLTVGYRATYGVSRVLMRFPGLNLSAIPSAAKILNATVEVRDLMCESTEMLMQCHVFAGNSWTESTANWSNVSPESYSAWLSNQTISYANGRLQTELYRYPFDITNAVRGWKAGNYSQAKGIIFKGSYEVENGSTYNCKTFSAYNRAQYEPSISVTYDDDDYQLINDNTYYINGCYSGDYLRYYSSAVTAKSGLIADLGNSIRWETRAVNGGYIVRSKTDTTKYLAVPSSTSDTSVTMVTVNNSTIPSRCIWNISGASGGGCLIKSTYNSKYLYSSGNSVATSSTLGTSGTTTYNKRVWRIASTTYYGTSSTCTVRELGSGFAVSNISMLVGETKSLSINKSPSNAAWATSSDFTYTLVSSSPSSAVSFNSSTYKFVASKSGTVVYQATHKITDRTTTFTISISNLRIYRTRNRETQGFIGNSTTPVVAEDLTFGEKSTQTICSNGTHISSSDLYQTNGNQLSMSRRIEIVKNFFNAQVSNEATAIQILGSMVDHFVDGTGTAYTNSSLTNAVKTHENTLTYTNGVIRLLKEYIENNNGNISNLYYDEGLWVQIAQRNAHPFVALMQADEDTNHMPYYGYNNGVPMLTLAIDGWYGNKIEIETFSKTSTSYSGTVRFVFYDHFGLDTSDLAEEKYGNLYAGYFEGFRQWYILQHWSELNSSVQPKPFVTNVSFTVSFSGTF